MPQWERLPAEIRYAVFEVLVPRERGMVLKHGLSQYSLVCKDWQPFFEKRLYRYLSLTQDSLHDFRRLVVRQRGLVKHIWLEIELSDDGCDTCLVCRQPPSRHSHHSNAFQAITRLWQALTSWDRDQVACPPGSLTLEISGQFPRHLEPIFRYRRTLPVGIDHLYGQVHCVSPDCGSHLLQVQVVGCFVLRRQTQHAFWPEAVAGLLHSLPNLGSVTYEPWWPLHSPPPAYLDPGHCRVITEALPKALRELTLSEDFEDYHSARRAYSMSRTYTSHRPKLMGAPDAAVGQALAERSLRLVRLSATNIVDAQDFFAAVDPAWVWGSLTSLSLTSHLLVYKKPCAHVTCLLVQAGVAALQMPQLKWMSIWNVTGGNACVFSYEATDEHTMIKWRGTRHMRLDLEVADVWSRVAELYTGRDLTIGTRGVPHTQHYGSTLRPP
ncbi:hypothetical protein OCS_00997 [Ophiocordyceps sinensis CO18]|nr:hypothetical protein OCS_00997 [Ophiocordyceps sinensis CO18]